MENTDFRLIRKKLRKKQQQMAQLLGVRIIGFSMHNEKQLIEKKL